MSVELKVPEIGESITEAQIAEWLKSEGDSVEEDEPLVVLETDKATVELPAPVSGTIGKLLKKTGDTVEVGEVIGHLEEGEPAAKKQKKETGKAKGKKKEEDEEKKDAKGKSKGGKSGKKEAASRKKKASGKAAKEREEAAEDTREREKDASGEMARDDGRDRDVGDEDLDERRDTEQDRDSDAERDTAGRDEEVVPMSPMRRRIAERLVEAKQQAALLTTFNEIDMSRVIEVRRKYQEAFQERYDVKLGFMSFFVRAVVEALREVPQLNAEIRGTDIAYRHYHDIGIAVGGGKGLVVPVLRDAGHLSFAETEVAIADFARRARDNNLELKELQGGTFTISNGGVYGSLLSTPIVNPPQSGILGLHAIQERPIASGGEVVIRPMMYVAVTYDHRIVDGREAVTFLRRIKETVEEPSLMLIEA